MKQLTRLFPNKVTIQMPQDENLLSDWKLQLDRDVESLKSQCNIISIRSVLSRNNLECPDLETVYVKDQALTSESVDKIIGWALSHHFMQCAEVPAKDAKLTISSESIRYGLNILQGIQNESKSSKKTLKSHPGGLLFKKFGSNQTALLDLAFPDNFGRLHDRSKDTPKTMKQLTRLFPNKVTIQMPQDENLRSDWKLQLDRDVETLKSQSNIISIRSVLSRNSLECPDLETVYVKDQALTSESVDKIIGWALSHHFMQCAEVPAKDAKLTISSESIRYGLYILQGIQNESKSSKKTLKDVVTEFEKRLLADVIPPRSDIGVTFDDIGALENVKDTLKELVMLPLQRPELFCKGQLTKERDLALADNRPLPALHASTDVCPLNSEDFKYTHEQVVTEKQQPPLLPAGPPPPQDEEPLPPPEGGDVPPPPPPTFIFIFLNSSPPPPPPPAEDPLPPKRKWWEFKEEIRLLIVQITSALVLIWLSNRNKEDPAKGEGAKGEGGIEEELTLIREAIQALLEEAQDYRIWRDHRWWKRLVWWKKEGEVGTRRREEEEEEEEEEEGGGDEQ